MLVYLDSNVFISLIDRELGRNIRGLFVEAELFFDKAKKEGHVLVLSDWFFKEVKKICYLDKEEVLEYFEKIGVNVKTVDLNEKVSFEEFSQKGVHFHDALHVAITLHFKCDCIVTFNVKDFEKASYKIMVFEPGTF